MAAHRYWRVRAIQANGFPNGAAEVELRTVIGGSTVTTGGTAISSGDYSGGYDKSYAFDGNPTDGHEWAGNAADGSWIGYDFGAGNEKDIVEVAYTARQFYGAQSPYIASLDYSDDGSAWTPSFSIKFGYFAGGETKVRSQVPAPDPGVNPHKWWRIIFDTSTGYCSGSEGELHLVPGGPDVTADLPIAFSDGGHYSDWSFSRMFDDDSGSLTACSGYGQAEFGDPVTLEEFVWTCRSGGGANYQVPLTGRVAYSDDGSTFTDAWSWDAVSWTDGETKTFTNPDAGTGPARRRRMIVVT
jgi:hypothetical protein